MPCYIFIKKENNIYPFPITICFYIEIGHGLHPNKEPILNHH